MLKYWRVIILLIMVIGACLAIVMKPQYTGAQILYVSDDSPAKGVLEQGAIIHKVNGERISGPEEWNSLMKGYAGEVEITVIEPGPRYQDYDIFINDTVGIEVTEIKK